MLQRDNLREQALSVIREGIVSGELEPGEIYSAVAIAEQLGVSASPVREAMLTLVNQGLVETVRNRGFRVLVVEESDRDEILQLRTMLEIPSMQDLAGDDRVKARRDEFAAIARDNIECAGKGDLVGFLDSDRRFHLGLLAILGNRRLVEIIGSLRDQTRLFGVKSMAERGVLIDSAKEHLAILEAILAGDRELIGSLMHRHFAHIDGDWSDGPR